MPFNERLKQLRKERDLSQDALAKAAGLSTDTVAKLERPNKEPSWNTAVKLADALGVRLDDFRDEVQGQSESAAPKKRRRKAD